MQIDNKDLVLGQAVVQRLVDTKAKPPLVRSEFRSLGKLNFELVRQGFRLVRKERHGVEAGSMLFYVRQHVLIRIKTRGGEVSRTKLPNGDVKEFRRGAPHLTVSLLSGHRVNGQLDTGYDHELGKFHRGGGLVNKAPNAHSPLYDHSTSLGKANAETWSDETHFDFPGLDLDDSIVDHLRVE